MPDQPEAMDVKRAAINMDRARIWDETPAEAARFDDRYWDAMYDRDED